MAANEASESSVADGGTVSMSIDAERIVNIGGRESVLNAVDGRRSNCARADPPQRLHEQRVGGQRFFRPACLEPQSMTCLWGSVHSPMPTVARTMLVLSQARTVRSAAR